MSVPHSDDRERRYPVVRQRHQTYGGRPVFEIVKTFYHTIQLGHAGHVTLRIPSGSLTDFASVPRLLWPIVNPLDPDVVVGALVHDALYQQGFSRASADSLLRILMAYYGAGWRKQVRVYYAVRLFGWLCFPSRPICPELVVTANKHLGAQAEEVT